MNEERIQVFIDSVNRYFNEVNNFEVIVGTPYLIDNKNPKALDYTGIIGISGGRYKGCVYFSAPKVLLSNLLVHLGEDASEENIVDIIGEIANTISGNARSEYGEDFMISVPAVVSGMPGEIHLPREARSYVIPMKCKRYDAVIVVCLTGD